MENTEKYWKNCTKTELLKLPILGYGEIELHSYDAILIFSTRKKHESGYNYFCVVGCKDVDTPTHIIKFTDAIFFDDIIRYLKWKNIARVEKYEIDCSMHGIFRYYNRDIC